MRVRGTLQNGYCAPVGQDIGEKISRLTMSHNISFAKIAIACSGTRALVSAGLPALALNLQDSSIP